MARSARWLVRALALAVVVCVPGVAHALRRAGQVHVEAGPGYDSNAGRELDGLARGDGFLLGVLRLDGALAGDGAAWPTLQGEYRLGAKHFFRLAQQDVVAQSARLALTERAGPWALALQVRAKDRRSRGGDRDYTDLGGGAQMGRRLGRVALDLDLGVERFIYRPDGAYSFTGPLAVLTAALPLTGHHRLQGELGGSWRSYGPSSALGFETSRRDGTASGGLGWRYKGKFIAEAGYDFLANLSNQPGRSYQRHRLSARGAVFLPLHIALALTGTIQLTHFPGGVALAPDLLLTADSENTNALTVSLSRQLPWGLSVQLQGAGYQADYATNGLRYHRLTTELTIGWKR